MAHVAPDCTEKSSIAALTRSASRYDALRQLLSSQWLTPPEPLNGRTSQCCRHSARRDHAPPMQRPGEEQL